MKGILKGLRVTLRHIFKKKVTRVYPYEKRELPERSRGLIQLLREPETGLLKCEACLLCEKVCPPRAITIQYRQRGVFRRRPPFAPRTIGGFYRPRMAAAAPYRDRPLPTAVQVAKPDEETSLALAKVDEILAEADGDLMGILRRVQAHYGYLPRVAAELVSAATGVDMSDIYSMASLGPGFRARPLSRDQGGAADG